MKKNVRVTMILFLMLAAFTPSLTQAFNPGAHIYIAERVFPFTYDKIDLFYGSIAPDLCMYIPPEGFWSGGPIAAFFDTHYDFIDLPYTWWKPAQRAFAKGWKIHNEIWGADHFAHGTYPYQNSPSGYVITKIPLLVAEFPILNQPPNFELAHFAIEVAIDLLLLKNDDPYLGHKVLGAALLRSPEGLNLVAKVFVGQRITNWQTLSTTESAFRNLVIEYGTILTLPESLRMVALAELGVQIAQRLGVSISLQTAQEILERAVELCGGDYYPIIESAIDALQ